MNRRAFRWLWASDALSVFGGEITMLALPLAAAVWLQATPPQMGALVAAEMLPYGLFSLHAGALIDRWRKLPLLRATAFARAALMLAVPVLAAWGRLSMDALFVVAFCVSCLAVFADPAYQALMPQLVPPDELVRANARLGVTQSAAGIAAPGLAGLLAQALGAPMALAIDALAVLGAGWALGRVRHTEPPPTTTAAAPLWPAIVEGLAIVRHDATLRSITALLAAWQLLKHAFVAVFMLFAVKTLGLAADLLGLVMVMPGVGFCLASMSIARLQQRAGLGPTMLGGLGLAALAWAAAGLAGGPTAASQLGLAMGLEGFGAGLFFLGLVSLRQAQAPAGAVARVVTSMRFLTIGATPLGALAGGWLAGQIGLRETVVLAATAGALVAAAAVLLSPLRRQRHLPGTPAPAERNLGADRRSASEPTSPVRADG